MKNNKVLRLITAIAETILGVPLIGGSIVLGMLWLPLPVMLALHIVTLIFCTKEKADTTGSILGIVASLLGWIPILGMILHLVTAILLWIGYSKKD